MHGACTLSIRKSVTRTVVVEIGNNSGGALEFSRKITIKYTQTLLDQMKKRRKKIPL